MKLVVVQIDWKNGNDSLKGKRKMSGKEEYL